jgi:hypothetical protein
MNKETGKQVWNAPKLEQIAMVDTAAKGNFPNEASTNPKLMGASGGNS